jgi:hypothetical protein
MDARSDSTSKGTATVSQPEAPRGPEEPQPYPSNGYAWYCVVLLLAIYLNSFLDRQMIALVDHIVHAHEHAPGRSHELP